MKIQPIKIYQGSVGNFVEKIKGWHVALFSFIVFSLFIVANADPGILTGDEMFYYFQAQHLKEGEFFWFNHTQPPLTSLVLSIFPTANPIVLKVGYAALFLSLSCGVLFHLSRKIIGQKAAVVAALLFTLHKATLTMAGLLYTEAMFIFLLLLSFLIFYKLYFEKDQKTMTFIFFGMVMGLLLLTRVVGLMVPSFFLLFLLIQDYRLLRHRYWLSFLIAGAALLLYFPLGTFSFLQEKSGSSMIFQNITGAMKLSTYYLTWSMVLLLLLAFISTISQKERDQEKTIAVFMVYYLLFLSAVTTLFFDRYLFVLIPFGSILAAKMLWQGRVKYIAGALMILTLAFTIHAAPHLPETFSQNYYLEVPSGCLDVSRFDYVCGHSSIAPTGIAPTSIVPTTITLPLFNLPPGQSCTLETNILLQEEYSYLYLVNLDDRGEITIYEDNLSIQGNIYNSLIIPKALSEGPHHLRITITNDNNIGGIGQLLLCRDWDGLISTPLRG